MADGNETFYSEHTTYRTYRELLVHMAASVRKGLANDGIGAVWNQDAALFGFINLGRYCIFVFTNLPCRFIAGGQSADEAYGSLVWQMDQCKELDKELT